VGWGGEGYGLAIQIQNCQTTNLAELKELAGDAPVELHPGVGEHDEAAQVVRVQRHRGLKPLGQRIIPTRVFAQIYPSPRQDFIVGVEKIH
jgi:hypothetical protein